MPDDSGGANNIKKTKRKESELARELRERERERREE